MPGFRSPGNGVRGSRVSQFGICRSSLDPLDEQLVLLTTEPTI